MGQICISCIYLFCFLLPLFLSLKIKFLSKQVHVFFLLSSFSSVLRSFTFESSFFRLVSFSFRFLQQPTPYLPIFIPEKLRLRSEEYPPEETTSLFNPTIIFSARELRIRHRSGVRSLICLVSCSWFCWGLRKILVCFSILG